MGTIEDFLPVSDNSVS